MNTRHTPGPWEAIEGSNGYLSIKAMEFIDDVQMTIAGVEAATNRTYYPTRREATANARLIAAAPDLLEALKGLLLFPNNPRENLKARAAIAKATVGAA